MKKSILNKMMENRSHQVCPVVENWEGDTQELVDVVLYSLRKRCAIKKIKVEDVGVETSDKETRGGE